MKSNRTWLAGMLAAAALMAGSVAHSAPPEGHGGHHRDGMQHLLAQLNLSTEQHASIHTILAGAGPQMKSLHEEMRANRLKLRQTQPNDPNYPSVVAQVTQANGSLHSQMIMQKESVRAQVFNVLTPAQQTQLAALQAQQQPH